MERSAGDARCIYGRSEDRARGTASPDEIPDHCMHRRYDVYISTQDK